MNNRAAFIDFCQGLLNMDATARWTPQQARLHPFITGEKWTQPWQVRRLRLLGCVGCSMDLMIALWKQPAGACANRITDHPS